jgi:hypothetical protein
VFPLNGGSGGGGGWYYSIVPTAFGAGGGGGGGAILLASSTSIAIAGSIRANGGARGDAHFTDLQYGGAGSGGSIHLLAPLVTVDGALTATPGLAYVGPASPGYIRIEGVSRQLAAATISPQPALATALGQPLILSVRRTLRVTSIVDQAGTQLVQNPPTASFSIPDVTIEDSGPVAVNIVAENIPVGTVVQLYVISENGPSQIVDSTPLAGAAAASSATATVTLPAGFSRGFARAVFTPPTP